MQSNLARCEITIKGFEEMGRREASSDSVSDQFWRELIPLPLAVCFPFFQTLSFSDNFFCSYSETNKGLGNKFGY